MEIRLTHAELEVEARKHFQVLKERAERVELARRDGRLDTVAPSEAFAAGLFHGSARQYEHDLRKRPRHRGRQDVTPAGVLTKFEEIQLGDPNGNDKTWTWETARAFGVCETTIKNRLKAARKSG